MNKNLNIDEKVQDFYETLPFNIYGDLDIAVDRIKKISLLERYPVLKNVFENRNIKNVVDYKLSHEDYGFEEPIFSFVPSIGITEIIKIPNNFSKHWQNNFLIGSMNSKHLFRVKFDKSYSKILFIEKIFIGERIRDLFYLDNKKQILLSLEDTGSIGILEIEK